MLWLYLALIAYAINALVFIIDKHLLAGHIPKYHAYAFGVSVLSLSTLVLIPFGFKWQGWEFFSIAMACGAAFFLGLTFLYKSIKESDVSVAATQTGTMGAIFTYLLSIVILKDALPPSNLFALVLLIVGILLLGKIEKRILIPAVLSGLFFGLSFVLLKLSFIEAGFVNGVVWTRIGFVGAAFLSLFSVHVRQEVVYSFHHAPTGSKFLFIFNKILAGIGFTILYVAINLGSISLINGLLGIQFLFTFILMLFLKEKVTGIKEKIDNSILALKLMGITAVLVGFLILFMR